MVNDGYIAFDDVGRDRDNEAVLCHTNKPECCGTMPVLGNWFFPNGSTVRHYSNIGDAPPFFTRNRGQKVVRLYIIKRSSTRTLEGGRFRCVVPNATNINITHYVNICTFLPVVIGFCKL